MKVVLRDKAPPISPETKDDYGIIFDKDIKLHKRSRLKLKFLVFDTFKGLNDFFAGIEGMPSAYGSEGQAAGQVLAFQSVHENSSKPYMSVDRYYFAWLGLVKGHIGMDFVAHEAVHAAFAYERRLKRNVFGAVGEFDEERIAYATGWVAWHVLDLAYRHHLFEK